MVIQWYGGQKCLSPMFFQLSCHPSQKSIFKMLLHFLHIRKVSSQSGFLALCHHKIKILLRKQPFIKVEPFYASHLTVADTFTSHHINYLSGSFWLLDTENIWAKDTKEDKTSLSFPFMLSLARATYHRAIYHGLRDTARIFIIWAPFSYGHSYSVFWSSITEQLTVPRIPTVTTPQVFKHTVSPAEI